MKKLFCIFINFSFVFCLPQTAEDILSSMTLEQKIGQVVMIAVVSNDEQEARLNKSYPMNRCHVEKMIQLYHIGGIMFFGAGKKEEQKALTNYFQSLSKVPLFVAQDLEPGRVGRSRLPDEFNYPSNKVIGEEKDDTLAYETGLSIGKQCNELGVHINFAPVADVNNNPLNPVINDRSFGDDMYNVAQKGIAFMRGLQDAGILACAKHFPGHGDTAADSHYSLPVLHHDEQRLRALELYPFKKLIDAGVDAVMIAHLAIPALEPDTQKPSSLSKNIVTGLLQKELGFEGLIITDALDMGGVTKNIPAGKREVKALIAGNDILLVPTDLPVAVKAIKKAIKKGKILESDLDAHVLKILRIKAFVFNT